VVNSYINHLINCSQIREFRGKVEKMILTLLGTEALRAAPPFVLAPTFKERWRLEALLSIHSSLSSPEVMCHYRSELSLAQCADRIINRASGVRIFKDKLILRWRGSRGHVLVIVNSCDLLVMSCPIRLLQYAGYSTVNALAAPWFESTLYLIRQD
jgi:hypothetical protein